LRSCSPSRVGVACRHTVQGQTDGRGIHEASVCRQESSNRERSRIGFSGAGEGGARQSPCVCFAGARQGLHARRSLHGEILGRRVAGAVHKEREGTPVVKPKACGGAFGEKPAQRSDLIGGDHGSKRPRARDREGPRVHFGGAGQGL